MEDFDVLYICDRKACENCYEECMHTSDIEHAIHRYDLHGRTFRLIEGDNNHKGFFEVV